ncbi:MAG: hypothetical protein A2Y38_06595 [Spirochaetes bacterium GWB1_59_5]|nr:MAG: hypothetical protein A2Y38_06595 [Spirochaetes bacterium GWB1_59_5]
MRGDPFWMAAKYPGRASDGTPVRKGDRVLYWPKTKTIMIGKAAEAAWRQFEAEVADEGFYNRSASLAQAWGPTLKQAAEGKVPAVFWFEVGGIQNKTVDEYEAEGGGLTYMEGDFLIRGVLHVQWQGAVWDGEIPWQGQVHLGESPQSGTLIFSTEKRFGIAGLVQVALQESPTDQKVYNTLKRSLRR